MAVFGAQLVVSMITASFLSKLSVHYSFGRWLLCNRLVRYMHPSDEELKNLAGIPNNKPRGKKGDKHEKKANEPFTVPKNLDLQLDSLQVTPVDVVHLHYYGEYQWLLDFSVCAVFVYIFTEVYYALFNPGTEVNLSMLWCMLVLGFCLKILFSLTAMYFTLDEGGERILCVVFCFFFLVLAMAVLIVNEDMLEFGLVSGYQNFTEGAKVFLSMQGVESQGPQSLLTYRIVLAIFSAILGAFLTFPGLRLAKMHTDAVKYGAGSALLQTLLHLNIIAPLFVTLLWLKPIARDYLIHEKRQLIDHETFDSLRIIALMVVCILRFLVLRPHLQAHLNLAVERLQALKKEAGRISSVDLQKLVARVFYYLCVVALQYLAPLIMLLFCTFMLKTLGGLTWIRGGITVSTANVTSKVIPQNTTGTISETAAQFAVALAHLKQVFTPLYFRGLFSFLCWWINTAWFATTVFGLVYYNYFSG